MNRAEIERLAAATNALRPDWNLRSLVTFIARNLDDRAWADAAVALAAIATDPATKTPARVLESGPWWRSSPATIHRPPAAHESCPIHGDWAGNCRGCAADRKAVRTDPFPEDQETQ